MLTKAERKELIKLAAALPKSNKARQAILAGLEKQAKAGRMVIDVGQESLAEGRPKQHWVQMTLNGRKDQKFFQVRRGEWRTSTGDLLRPEFVKIVEDLLI